MFKRLLLAGAASLSLAGAGQAVPVDTELMLLSDVSGSIDPTDFGLMMDGYEAAFRSASVINAIEGGANGAIAVSLGFFNDTFSVGIDWFLIDSAASANAFADLIAAIPYTVSLGDPTGLTAGLLGAAATFAGNGFEGVREVIDVAGDGAESVACAFGDAVCAPLQNARDSVLAGGIDVINALFIRDAFDFGDSSLGDTIDAVTYGTTNLIGGDGAFVSLIGGFQEFGPAIEGKLIQEISGEIPVPLSLPLIASGLGMLLVVGRRRRGSDA